MRWVFNELKSGTFDRQKKECCHLLRVIFAQALLLFLACIYGGMGRGGPAEVGSGEAMDAAQTHRDFLSNPPVLKKIEFRPDQNSRVDLMDGAQTYRDFLSNPPWLKTIKFRLDRNYRVDVTDEHHPQREEGTGIYEAALQPGGYYRKHLEGSPLYDNPPGQIPRNRPVEAGRETISGASDRFYWRLWEGQDEISLVPKDDQSGASADNWLRGFFNFELADLEKIRRFGLDHLVDARITWIDKDHFTAVSSSRGSAHGTIVHYTNGLPETVEYSFDSASSLVFRVRYVYESGKTFPPQQMTVEETDPNGNRLAHINYIDELDVGLDPNAKAGYHPEEFRVRAEPFKQVSISSNGVLYHVDQRGRLNAVDTKYVGFERFLQPKPRPMIAALVLVTPSLAFFLYFVIARRRAKRQDNININ